MPGLVERTCIACRKKGPQGSFIRLGRTPAGDVATGRVGRGAYFCASRICAEEALRKDRLSRALRCAVTDAAKDRIREELECRLR